MNNIINNDAEFFSELNQIYPQVNYLEGTQLKPATADIIFQKAWGVVRDELADFVSSSNFYTDMQTAFSSGFDLDNAKEIVNNLVEGEKLPLIVVAPENLLNGARGAFDSLTGTVYVTDALINDTDLSDVLIEELGHQIDSLLNPADSPGDEGELFSRLVGGEELSKAEIKRLQNEDDRVKIFDGLEVEASSKLTFEMSSFPTYFQPEGIAVADFDKDGFQDLVVANVLTEDVSMFRGNGKGEFSTSSTFNIGGAPMYVAVGDFNRDSNPDVVATKRDNDNIVVLLGNGKAEFSSGNQYSATDYWYYTRTWRVAVADVNQDNKLDVVTTNLQTNDIFVYPGTGDGKFILDEDKYSFTVGASIPGALIVEDFNGDGKLDVVTGNYGSDNISVLLGNGDATFGSPSNFAVGGKQPSGIAATDFNGDKKLDIVVTNQKSDNISVMFGKGDGSFSSPSKFPVGEHPLNPAIGDLNNDGKPDIITANSDSDTISVLLGKGKGNFETAIDFSTDNGRENDILVETDEGNSPQEVVVEDFNGDGKLDIAVTNFYSSNVSILLNTSNIGTNQPKIAIEDTTIVEGNKGKKNAKFTVTLDNPSDETVKVNYATANGTAKANKDYKPTKGSIAFKPGQTEKTITVPIFGDTREEGNEKFKLNLSKPKNAKLGDKEGFGTIEDNDDGPTEISIGNTSITEGNKGKKNAKFTVTLDNPSDETVKVNYATANGTAKANKDYKPTKGSITFKPGQTEKTITVPIFGDIREEKNEKFKLNLSKPKNAKLGDKGGIGTIKDND